MKYLIVDITHDNYPIAVCGNYKKSLKIAKKYVKQLFEEMDFFKKGNANLLDFYHLDMIEERLVGIAISDVAFNKLEFDRANYFWGHIKEDGTAVNMNDKYE